MSFKQKNNERDPLANPPTTTSPLANKRNALASADNRQKMVQTQLPFRFFLYLNETKHTFLFVVVELFIALLYVTAQIELTTTRLYIRKNVRIILKGGWVGVVFAGCRCCFVGGWRIQCFNPKAKNFACHVVFSIMMPHDASQSFAFGHGHGIVFEPIRSHVLLLYQQRQRCKVGTAENIIPVHHPARDLAAADVCKVGHIHIALNIQRYVSFIIYARLEIMAACTEYCTTTVRYIALLLALQDLEEFERVTDLTTRLKL